MVKMVNMVPTNHPATPDAGPGAPAGRSGSPGNQAPGSPWPDRRPDLVMFWLLAGSLLVMLHLALAQLSPHLGYGAPRPTWAILTLVGLEVSAGAVYLAVVRWGPAVGPDRSVLWWIVLLGLLLRLIMLGSTPMLAGDYNRSLWDGAVVAHGFNPYQFAPETVMTGAAVPETLRQLAHESGAVIGRINHPSRPTLYPPVAEAAFALAYWLAPWSITALRLVLLAFDLATLALVVLLLRALNLPLLALAIYWWNPVLLKEIINSGHMDVMALPLVLAAVWLLVRVKPTRAFAALAGGVGAQIWPLALVPLTARAVSRRPKFLGLGLALFVLLAGLMFLPIYTGGREGLSGFWAYGRGWEMNDALFKLVFWGSTLAVKGLKLAPGTAPDLARLLVGVLLAAWVLWLSWHPVDDGLDLARRGLLILVALFFLSPTQFPWYFTWLLPFLVLGPRTSLLLLTALLPIYYLRYIFLAQGRAEIFDYGIVWLEYLPVWILLLREFWVSRQHPSREVPQLSIFTPNSEKKSD
jgi:alpha-1,6-mannosyltransferase